MACERVPPWRQADVGKNTSGGRCRPSEHRSPPHERAFARVCEPWILGRQRRSPRSALPHASGPALGLSSLLCPGSGARFARTAGRSARTRPIRAHGGPIRAPVPTRPAGSAGGGALRATGDFQPGSLELSQQRYDITPNFAECRAKLRAWTLRFRRGNDCLLRFGAAFT